MKKTPHLLGLLIFLILATGLFYIVWVLIRHQYDWAAIRPYWQNLLSGWGHTAAVSSGALILSVIFGAFLTIGQLSPFLPAKILARGYIEFIRGVPFLVLILVGYYIVADSMGWDNRLSFGIVIMALFSGAYLSEIFRAGVESIPQSQWLSARAIGLSPRQTYLEIVIPQAVRRVLPASAGQFANLIKDSSLLYLISVPEFFMQARGVNAKSYATFEAYLPLVIGYLALTFPISLWSRHLERKFGFDQ